MSKFTASADYLQGYMPSTDPASRGLTSIYDHDVKQGHQSMNTTRTSNTDSLGLDDEFWDSMQLEARWPSSKKINTRFDSKQDMVCNTVASPYDQCVMTTTDSEAIYSNRSFSSHLCKECLQMLHNI